MTDFVPFEEDDNFILYKVLTSDNFQKNLQPISYDENKEPNAEGQFANMKTYISTWQTKNQDHSITVHNYRLTMVSWNGGNAKIPQLKMIVTKLDVGKKTNSSKLEEKLAVKFN